MRRLILTSVALLLLSACSTATNPWHLTAGEYSYPLCKASKWHYLVGTQGPPGVWKSDADCSKDPSTHGLTPASRLAYAYWLRGDSNEHVPANYYMDKPDAVFEAEQAHRVNADYK